MISSLININWEELEGIIQEPNITDIQVINNEIWVTDLHKGTYLSEQEMNESNITRIIHNLATNMNDEFNISNPILDASTDELRINAIHPSISKNGLSVSIRKTPPKAILNPDMMINSKYIEKDVLELIEKLVNARCNIIISGETGSGKTELLKYLAKQTPIKDRIITIEDTLEVRLKELESKRNIVSLKSSDSVSYKDLIKASLRQNPKWIMVSEARGEEVNEMLSAVSTGHSILTTVHSPQATQIPTRLMVLMGNNGRTQEQNLRNVHELLDIGIQIQLSETKEGVKRKVVQVVEFFNEGNEQKVNVLYDYFLNKPLSSVRSEKINFKLELAKGEE